MPNPETIEFVISSTEAGQRADRVIAARIESLSRTAIQRLIAEEQVRVNTAPIKPRHLLQEGDWIVINIPPAQDAMAQPEDIPLNVVYEDSDIIVINKPPDMVVHPAPGSPSGTLVNALLSHCKDLSGIGGVKRPGIVHRIDKDTTGLLAVAKNDAAHESLTAQLASRSMKRSYLVLLSGTLNEDSGTIDAPIGRSRSDRTQMAVCADGREARTHWRILRRTHGLTLVQADLDTGRSHQIRVHFQYMGYPVVGDHDYGGSPKQVAARLPERAVFLRQWARSAPRQMLHAFRLTLTHPRTGKEMTFEAPPPEDFQRIIDHLADAD
ncbi:MAG: RluA family pseudouridine synthase [Candidatus Sumerlaeota bacterium]|nr:RluA family pseudouridine synthase [Candidatus Sumerlaeota bacterium]